MSFTPPPQELYPVLFLVIGLGKVKIEKWVLFEQDCEKLCRLGTVYRTVYSHRNCGKHSENVNIAAHSVINLSYSNPSLGPDC